MLFRNRFGFIGFVSAIIIVFCFAITKSYAQTDDIAFKTIATKQGLPYPDIKAITKDKDGYVWIGSASGLFRFDGAEFEVFKKIENDSSSLGCNVVVSFSDDDSLLYCGTGKGLSILNKNTGKFKSIRLAISGKDTIQTNYIKGFYRAEPGFIFIVTNYSIVKYNKKTGNYIQIKRDFNDPSSVTSDTVLVCSDSYDKIRNGFWIPTFNGLNFYSYNEKKFYNYLYNPKKWNCFDNKYIGACMHAQNKVYGYVPKDSCIVCYDLVSNTKTKYTYIINGVNALTSLDLTCFTADTDGNIVIGDWQTPPVYFNSKTQQFSYIKYNSKDPLSILGSFLQCLYTDANNNIWFGAVDGISIALKSQNKYRVYFPMNSSIADSNRYSSYIYAMYEDADTTLWFGTDGLGLWKMDYHDHSFNRFSFTHDSGYGVNNIFSLADVGNEIWVGTRTGPKQFNKTTHDFLKINEVDNSPQFMQRTIYSLFLDSKKRMWMWNVGTGTYYYDLTTGKSKHFLSNPDSAGCLAHNFSYDFTELANGAILIANPYGYSLFKDTNNKVINYPIDRNEQGGLQNPQVKHILIDSKGNKWIQTFNGGTAMYESRTNKRHIFNDANALCSIYANDIAEDLYHNIWLTATDCIMRWIRTENRFERIDVPYNQDIVDYTKIVVSKTGKIYVSNFNSIIEIDPLQLDAGTKLSTINISSFHVFDKKKQIQNDLMQLSYSQNFFSIGYAAPEDIFADDIQYRYKLIGFDADWVNAGKQKTASYTNVPGGDYEFIVQARTGKQPWEKIEAKLNISISKIFYQTWWFRFLIALFIFLAIRFYVRYRDQQHVKTQEEEAITYFTNSQYTNNNAEEILWDVARNVISRLGFTDCVIYMRDENRNVLIQKAALDNKMKNDYTINNPIEIPIGKGIVGTVAHTGKAEIVNNTSKDERYIVDDIVRLSEIAVPIIHNNKVIGVIDSENSGKNFFTQNHLKLLETIASICADKIANAISRKQLQDKELKLLEYDKQVAEIRLMALRAQMNPHFIFNCLNSIDNFILKQQAGKASMYLNKFAKLIRLILNQSDKINTTLQTEIEIITYYLELEEQRFGEKFTYTISDYIDDDLSEIEIPSMVIQPFVENAILHGIMNREGDGGVLKINFAINNSSVICTIEDNGVGREKANEIKSKRTSVHTSKAMKVTEDRLVLLQQKAQQVAGIEIIDMFDNNGNACGTKVILNIPLLNDETVTYET